MTGLHLFLITLCSPKIYNFLFSEFHFSPSTEAFGVCSDISSFQNVGHASQGAGGSTLILVRMVVGRPVVTFIDLVFSIFAFVNFCI